MCAWLEYRSDGYIIQGDASPDAAEHQVLGAASPNASNAETKEGWVVLHFIRITAGGQLGRYRTP